LRWSELTAKDCRELFGSTPYLLLLLVAGPLAGMSFIAAVHAYAEASSGAALASALSPLDGILVPTLGAYDLLITFLVPFVAIRMISAEKASGALTLLLQTPASLASQLAAKLAALLLGWAVCLVPAAVALLLWRSYGGHLHAPEVMNLLLGHTLRYAVTCSAAMAAASIFSAASSAAIAVLSVTIGTWALDFFAAGRGGWIASVAAYTPAAILRQFERGLLPVDAIVAAIVISLAMLAVAAAFLKRRPARAVAALAIVALVFVQTKGSADVSEDRRNSFSPADERLLRSIEEPVIVRLHLAAEDPRANDYERNVLAKLRRSVGDLRVEYPYAGQAALFENDGRYGTIVYRIGRREHVSRSTTEEIVLDDLETLAGLTPPRRGEAAYPGYPLAAAPRGAAAAFYVIWPLLVLAAWMWRRR
jgi:ABC-2 type transport system permease protein